jgi:hypothetical protein
VLQPTGFGIKLAKPTGAQAQASNSYVTHITISIHNMEGTFFVVTLNQGKPVSLSSVNKPTFDDHLSTALMGKVAKNIAPDHDLLQKLENEGFLYPFHNASRRFPNKDNMTVKKAVNSLRMNQAEINVKAFVFVLDTVEEKSVDDWCKLLTDAITPALQKQDTVRMRAGILKNKPEYSPYIPGNNISVRLAADKYSPLDNAITDIDVSKYFEWIAKNIGGHIKDDGSPVDTIEGGAWQVTIYERYEQLRDGFYTEWEETGFNTFPIITYGFPFSQTTPMNTVAKRIEVLINAFNALTDDDGQNSSVTHAHALVSSFATLLRTSVPANVGMIAYVRIKEWRAAMDGKPYVNNVAEQLEMFDSEFAKYQLAYRDTSLKKEKEETVPTLPIADTTAEPPKKKPKKNERNVSRQVTLPQPSNK